MKKGLLVFVMMMIVGVGKAQMTLTHGEVYNYDVGDVFCVEERVIDYQQSWPPVPAQPYTYYKTTILSKYFSSLLDTVFYNCYKETQLNEFVLNAAQTNYEWQFTYSFQNITLYYTDLNSPIQNYPFAYYFNEPCYTDSIDSVYIDTLQYCNRKIWHKNPIDSSICLEPPNPTWDYVSGCGGPYYSYMEYFSGPVGYSSKLIYYKKGNDSCGTNVVFATGVSKILNPQSSITFYPNPATNNLTIGFSELQKNTSVIITDVLGNTIQQLTIKNQKSETVDVSGLAKGIYFIEVVSTGSTNGKEVVRKKFVKQ